MERLTAALDAWAILALLRDEAAAARVETAVREGAICSWINLGEVLYIETRRLGPERAGEAVSKVVDNVSAELPDEAVVRLAAELKVEGGISFADCFAAATAERHGVPLLTGDAELITLERETLRVVDLRAPARPS